MSYFPFALRLRFTKLTAVSFMIVFFVPLFIYSKEVEIDSSVSKQSAQVAESFNYEIRVLAPIGSKITFPNVGTNLGDLEIIDHSDLLDLPSENDVGRRLWIRRYTLESYQAGPIEIPSIEILMSSKTFSKSLATEKKEIVIESALKPEEKTDQFRDIKQVIDLEETEGRNYRWTDISLAALFGLCAAVYLIYLFYRKRKWLSPYQWATQELQAISETSPDSESYKTFQQMEHILRVYLSQELDSETSALTFQEIIERCDSQGISADNKIRIVNLLERSEQARFAGVTFSKSDIQETIQIALEFVQDFSDEKDPSALEVG